MTDFNEENYRVIYPPVCNTKLVVSLKNCNEVSNRAASENFFLGLEKD
jgi:hypothetical protein